MLAARLFTQLGTNLLCHAFTSEFHTVLNTVAAQYPNLGRRIGPFAFGVAAMELPELDSSVAILTADLAFFSGLDRFKAKYPERLFNVGIAEQNMLGVAAGMAKEGHKVFATTYATFASARSCDQVRVNMGHMHADIKLVGLAAGLSVGILGATHMSIEDVAIMRAIPNITILCPGWRA